MPHNPQALPLPPIRVQRSRYYRCVMHYVGATVVPTAAGYAIRSDVGLNRRCDYSAMRDPYTGSVRHFLHVSYVPGGVHAVWRTVVHEFDYSADWPEIFSAALAWVAGGTTDLPRARPAFARYFGVWCGADPSKWIPYHEAQPAEARANG